MSFHHMIGMGGHWESGAEREIADHHGPPLNLKRIQRQTEPGKLLSQVKYIASSTHFANGPLFTVAYVANFIGMSPGQFKRVFRQNKNLFIQGVHYFTLSVDDHTMLLSLIHFDSSTIIDLPLVFTKAGVARFTDSIDFEVML